MKKKLAIFGAAAVAVLGLASCGGSNTPAASSSKATPTSGNTPSQTSASTPAASSSQQTPTSTGGSTSGKGLDIALNYSGKQGITLRVNSYVNTAEGVTYTKGDLLPTWNYFQTAVGTTIREASAYTNTSDNDYYTTIDTAGYKSETDTTQFIDLFYNSTSNINKMGNAGKAKDLTQYLNVMPNFKAFLEANPTIRKQITTGGKIYYTPYFDGYNAIERMEIMDTNIAKKVIDATNFDDFDTTKNGTGAATNTLQAAKYEPFIDANHNYPNATTTLKVSVNGQAQNVTIPQVDNIIKAQNALLANGATGKELAQQFHDYLQAAYGHLVGEGKLYSALSDVFVSEAAAYNTDELIALMRVVKANPGVITGNPAGEVEVFTPRGVASNRVQNVVHLLGLFGVQGQDAEKEGLFFDANGKINDAYALESTYEALNKVSALYDEGLILGDFFSNASTLGNTGYLNKYFGKTADGGGYGFMLYDYSASTGAVNTIDEYGIGTADGKRVDSFKDTSVTGVRPVLPPVTWWATETSWDHEQALSNHNGMTLIRRSTSNRTLKSNSWCIPTTSDNPEEAAKLMDYLFSTDGALVNDFGPKNDKYWKSTTNLGTYNGQATPEFSDALKEMIRGTSEDFWSFMRGYIGSTHGIGYVRSASINYLATNKWAQVGSLNIENAIASEAVVLDKVDKHGADTYSWDNSVPSAGYGSESDKNSYAAVTAFWGADKCTATASGWVTIVVNPVGTFNKNSSGEIGKDANSTSYSYKDVFDQLEARIINYLGDLVSGYDEDLLPDYAFGE